MFILCIKQNQKNLTEKLFKIDASSRFGNKKEWNEHENIGYYSVRCSVCLQGEKIDSLK